MMIEFEKLKWILEIASAFVKPNPLAKQLHSLEVDSSHRVSLAEY
jgi:hypothetical protein